VFGSMLAMRWCTQAVTRRPLTAWLAGLAYGCSPYLVSQGTAHLNLCLVMVPPLLTRVLLELYTGRVGWRAAGLRLAALTVVQFLITEEVLASYVVTAAAASGVLALRHRHAIRRVLLRRVGAALVLGSALAVAVLGVVLYVQLFGRLALTGPAAVPTSFSADVLGLVIPNRTQLLHNASADGFSGNPSENGSFLGPVVLALIAWNVMRRRGQTRDWALVALVAWVLSLSGFVRIGGHPTPVKLPFLVVWRLPLLGSLAPARFSLYVGLAVILSLAAASEAWTLPRTALRRIGWGVLALGAAVPLLPAWPYAYVPLHVPAWFAQQRYRELPRGAVLETYPVARHRYGSPTSSPVEWQAVADFWYRTTGGYVVTRAPDGRGTQNGGVTAWERAAYGKPVPAAAVRAEWQRLGVTAVAVDPTARGARQVEALMKRLTGRPPDEQRLGMELWRLR
jgi:hypothetical protein